MKNFGKFSHKAMSNEEQRAMTGGATVCNAGQTKVCYDHYQWKCERVAWKRWRCSNVKTGTCCECV